VDEHVLNLAPGDGRPIAEPGNTEVL